MQYCDLMHVREGLVGSPVEQWLNEVHVHDVLASRISLNTDPQSKLLLLFGSIMIAARGGGRNHGVGSLRDVGSVARRTRIEHVTELGVVGPLRIVGLDAQRQGKCSKRKSGKHVERVTELRS